MIKENHLHIIKEQESPPPKSRSNPIRSRPVSNQKKYVPVMTIEQHMNGAALSQLDEIIGRKKYKPIFKPKDNKTIEYVT